MFSHLICVLISWWNVTIAQYPAEQIRTFSNKRYSMGGKGTIHYWTIFYYKIPPVRQ